jgi:nucleotide-binding universal stress UspA family protein
MINKLLVPIDGSSPARRALALALKFGSEIHIVNVQREADSPVLLLHITPDQLRQQQLEHGDQQVAEARRVLENDGRPHRVHVCIGDPASEIARVAREQQVDGIVMGTRGMTAFVNLTFGSIATKVVHLTDVPVTLVK